MQGCIKHNLVLATPSANSFAGLMEMYEANYMYLRKFCGNKNDIPQVAVSRIATAMDLYLQVLEQTKYTTTIALTYYFIDHSIGFSAYPDLKIRIYYDALQAEVLSQAYKRQDPNFHAFNHRHSPSLMKRWRMNRFLYKWLSYCDRQGHSFNFKHHSRQNHLLTKNVEIPLQQLASYSTILK